MNKYIQSNRTLVCDIDDTISFTTNRNWKNAKPNVALINKLNKLYDNGWTIIYCTSRGSLSCSSREEAINKYKDIILNWFKRNNVKYSQLSFQKILAQYYIDDKAITPDEFVKLDIEIIKSTNDVYIQKIGNKFYKTSENSLFEASWYTTASDIIPTIKVHSIVGKTICLDFIKQSGNVEPELIDEYINKFRQIKSFVPFEEYISIVKDIVDISILNDLYKNADYFNSQKSFCHGNLKLSNTLYNNNLYFISPKNDTKYTSYLLDIANIIISSTGKIQDYFKTKYLNKQLELLIECEKIRQGLK